MDEGREDPRVARQRREERLRYEVLAMLWHAAKGDPEQPVDCRPLAGQIGVWTEEVYRAIDFLDRRGFVRYCAAGPIVCVTEAGMKFLGLPPASPRRIPDD